MHKRSIDDTKNRKSSGRRSSRRRRRKYQINCAEIAGIHWSIHIYWMDAWLMMNYLSLSLSLMHHSHTDMNTHTWMHYVHNCVSIKTFNLFFLNEFSVILTNERKKLICARVTYYNLPREKKSKKPLKTLDHCVADQPIRTGHTYLHIRKQKNEWKRHSKFIYLFIYL